MRASSAVPSAEAAQRARSLSRDELSLALIEARNVTLCWLSQFAAQGLLAGSEDRLRDSWSPVPLYMAGRLAWLQEWSIPRNLNRLQFASGVRDGARLASLDKDMDLAYAATAAQWLELPSPPSWDDTRSYLEATLEQTLDLLAACPPDDDSLFVYRWALQREDWLAESFAVAAQRLGVCPADELRPAHMGRPRTTVLQAIWMPPQRVSIGSAAGGFVPANERWAHAVDLPECDMDAQVVSWSQFAEFASDGGYDRPELWSPSSWAWVQAQARRAPRYVEQMRQGVLAERFGRLQRDAVEGAACHVTWHEADAWCRWAGRRLPSEVEWEAAAITAGSRGWCWAEVWEWVAGTARAWPSGPALPASAEGLRILRGASRWTVTRALHPRQRRFVAAERDELFVGFRSCAL